MIDTFCPLCQASCKLPDAQAGKRVRCPDCSGTFVAPGEAPPQKETVSKAPVQKAPVRKDPPPQTRPAPRPAPTPAPRRRVEEDDAPARRNSRDEDQRPRRGRDDDRDDRDDSRSRRKKKSSGGGAIIAVVLLFGLLVLFGGGGAAAYFLMGDSSTTTTNEQASEPLEKAKDGAGKDIAQADTEKGSGTAKGPGSSDKAKSTDKSEKEKPKSESEKEKPSTPEPITTPVLPTIPSTAPPNIEEESAPPTETVKKDPDPKPTDPKSTDPKSTDPKTKPADPATKALAASFALLQDADNDKVIKGLAALKEAAVEDAQRDAVGKAINPLLNRRGVSTQALEVAQRWTSKENLAKLINMLGNNDDFDGAAETLGYYKSEDAAKALAKHLPNGDRLAKVSEALKKIGKIAEKPVLAYLNHDKADVRSAVETLLKKFETSDENRRAQIIDDLESPNGAIKQNALENLAKIKPDKDSQAKVAKTVGGLLADKNRNVRLNALKCLGAWATDENVPALLELLDDKDKELRFPAIVLLGKLKDERAVEPLVARLGAPQEELKLVTAALVSIGPKAEKAVQMQLTNDKPQTRNLACLILAEIGTKESMQILYKLGKTGVINANAAALARRKITAREKAKAAKEKEKE